MIKKTLPEQNIPGYSVETSKPVNDVLEELSTKEDLNLEHEKRLLKIQNFTPKTNTESGSSE